VAEVKTDISQEARGGSFPGVEDLGMRDRVVTREPGRPWGPLSGEERMPNNRKKGGRQTWPRESDSLVVPENAGNVAGGKEATVDRAG
jgi:hypothetical protein